MKPFIAVIAFVVCCFVIPVNGETSGKNPDTHRKHGADAQSPNSKSSPAGTVNIDTVNVDKLNVAQQADSAGKGDKNSDKPPSYLCRLIAPETLPNTILCLVGIAAVIAAICTLFAIKKQARLMERQVRQMRRQTVQMIRAGKQTDRIIENMRDTAMRELRAYVCMSEAVIEFRQERAPEVRVYMKNCGKTPAYDVRWWNRMWLAEYPPKAALPEPPPNFVTTASLLAPGEKPHVMLARPDEPFPEQLMPKLGTPECTLFVYGKVVYRDAFGFQRYTRYRLMYGGLEPIHPRDKGGIKVSLLKPDLEGNEAD